MPPLKAAVSSAEKSEKDRLDALSETGPDERSGWRWQRLTAENARRELEALGGSFGDDARRIESGQASIFALKDPDGLPWLAAETQLGELVEFKGRQTKTLAPELRPFVTELSLALETERQSRGWALSTGWPAERFGVVAVAGLGLGFVGEKPSKKISEALKAALRGPQSQQTSDQALPALAALGWTDELMKAAPKASRERRDQALALAAKLGEMEMIERLLPLADPLAGDSAALRSAAAHGHAKAVKRLIPVSNPLAQGSAALQGAAAGGHLEAARLLLPVSDPLAFGSIALRSAAERGHLGTVELLLPVSDPAGQGLGAFYAAKRKGHERVAEAIEAAIKAQNPAALTTLTQEREAMEAPAAPAERALPKRLASRRAQAAPRPETASPAQP